MTQVFSPNDAGVRDFSHHISVRFQIDDDVFEGVSGIPALALLEFGVFFEGMNESDVMHNPDTFVRVFDLVLTDESAELLKRRMRDKANPITMTQIMDIMPWLMEQYGLRPSRPSSNSSAGSDSPDDGTSSTDSQHVEELTLFPSGRTAS